MMNETINIAYDAEGKVWMHGTDGADNINGIPLTVLTLTPEQTEAFNAVANLPGGLGITFINGVFSQIPKPVPTPLETINSIEMSNPITHRALRELILTIGQIYPAGQNTVFYQRCLAVEQAIQVERAKL